MLGKRGSVMLFLQGLGEDLTPKELKAFVQRALNEMDRQTLALKAAVCTCSIVRMSNPDDGESELHGLVEVQPAKAAYQAIDVLDGQMLKGARIKVRRYHHRTPLRDRRLQSSALDASNNRKGERRRRNLRIELVDR